MQKLDQVKETRIKIIGELLENPEKAKELHSKYTEEEVESVVEAIEILSSLVGQIKVSNKEKETFINDLTKQYSDVVNLVLELGSVENLLDRYDHIPYKVEINGECPSRYEGEEIGFISIETKNLLVYLKDDFEIINEISIYDNYGNKIGDFSLKTINTENENLMM